VAWSEYLAETQGEMDEVTTRLFPRVEVEEAPMVTLVDHDPEAEIKVVAAMCYPFLDLPETAIEDRVRAMTAAERTEIIRAYVGRRTNRRHKPGRALERTFYRFDVLSDYGAFRDLQRHRMLTIEWHPLGPNLGYTLPDEVVEAGLEDRYREAMERSAELHDELVEEGFEAQAPYAVALAYRIRYSMQINARAAMHMIELRTTPQGHAEYRRVCQEMHRLIGEEAAHTGVAEAMRFVDYGQHDLERLDAERRAEARRSAGNL
jgi:hypothetical protein